MCGRFANQQENVLAWDAYFADSTGESFEEIFDDVTVGFNIAPTQMIPIVTESGWLAARWGMIAPWVKSAEDISSKFATFNARSETVSEKATFRGAWNLGQRCIIPALGYYEWQKTEDGKQPFFVHADDGSPLFFGGLFEPALDSVSGSVAGIPASCTIITLPASNDMSPLHHRMPLMFSGLGSDPKSARAWLDSGSLEENLDALSWYSVDKAVNNTRNQGASLIIKQ